MYYRSTLNLLRLFVLVLYLFTCLVGRSQTNTPRTVKIDNNCGGYLEYLPAGYNTDLTKKYPTIIYIHGGASFGSGTTASLTLLPKVEGVPYYISKNLFPSSLVTPYGDTVSFIAISPQFMQAYTTPQNVKDVIDYVIAHYRVDPNRIYLTGYSLGGNAVWQAISNLAAAQRLAAIVPVAGYNNPYTDTTAQFIAGANLPVWAIHSNADQTISVTASINMVNKINSYNPPIPAILTRLATQSHDSTVTAAFNPSFRPNGKNVYEWMLQYARAYPPTANAGNDTSILLPVNSVTLSASRSSDPQGSALSYIWTKISGPAEYSISDTTAVNPVISGLLAGNYGFKLTVTDAAGLSRSATVKISVISPNPAVPPVANAGNDTTILLPQTSTILSASASYAPNGAIERYTWSTMAGPAQAVIASPGAMTTMVSNLKPGTYQFQLAVKDNLDSVGKAMVKVRLINPFPNVAPFARAGADQTISIPVNSVTLNGSASSDTDGVITSYHWRELNGPSQGSIATENAAITNVTNLVQGIYQFELTVQDDSAATTRDTIAVFVNPRPKLIQVNVYGGSYPGGTGWNNWNVQSNLTSSALSYSDGTASVVKAVLGGNSGVADNGAGYAVTMCPPEVGRTASYYFNPRTLVISGLDSNNQYTLEAYASRNGGAHTFYSVGSSTVDILVTNNFSNKAVFNNLTLANGKVTVNITSSSGSYNYINGFTLTEAGKAGSPNANKLPVAVAGADQTINLPVNQVTVNGSGSYDPDGSIASYSWQQLSGPSPATIASPNADTTAITGLDSGAYVFQLTVRDNLGAVSTNTVKITVGTAGYNNIPPVARAGADATINLPLDSVQLDGSASFDPDGRIVRYRWLKIAGPGQYSISDSSVVNPGIGNLFAGTYQFELTVTDNMGAIGKDTMAILVTATTPVPPVALAGPDTLLAMPANSTILDGSRSYSKDTTILSYYWRKISGPDQYTINDSTLVSPQLGNLTGGTYVFELDVTDNYGLTGKDSVAVTVKANQAPIAVAGKDTSLVLPVNSIKLNGGASYDPDGSVAAYRWTKLSGPASFSINDSTAISPVISNLTNGIYSISLTVTDNLGATGTSTINITVYPPLNIPPVAEAGPDQTILLPASSVTLNGSASKDSNGIIIQYAWRQLSGPSTSVLSKPDSVITDAGGLAAGTYGFELAVTDDSLAVTRDTVFVTVASPQRLIKVNVYGGTTPAGAGWNNWNVSSSLSSGLLSYSDSVSSTISAVLSASDGVGDNGPGYPVTMCPVEVGRTTSYYWTTRTLTISGLDATRRYNFEAYASRYKGTTNTFTIGTTSVSVNPLNNYANKVIFNAITPTNGKIVVTLNGSYNYLNGFMLTEYAATSGTAVGSAAMRTSGASLSGPDTTQSVTVFPNPFKDQVRVQISNTSAGQVRIIVIDASGRAIREYTFIKESGTMLQTLPLQVLPAGIYYIRVQMASWQRTIKVVK